MARVREFDTDRTLEAAMRLFWRKGYVATSMADIYEATGLKAGSLYAAFKDKESLFQQTFERYAARFRDTLPKNARGLAAIEAWLRLQAKLAADDPDRAGCLIINTVSEREAHSSATQALAQGRIHEIWSFFSRNLLLAQEAGELPKDAAIDAHADALLGAVFSIMMLGRAGADERTINNVTLAAFRALGR